MSSPFQSTPAKSRSVTLVRRVDSPPEAASIKTFSRSFQGRREASDLPSGDSEKLTPCGLRKKSVRGITGGTWSARVRAQSVRNRRLAESFARKVGLIINGRNGH